MIIITLLLLACGVIIFENKLVEKEFKDERTKWNKN